MLEKLASSVLSKYLGNYIKDINEENLRISLLRGSVSMQNVKVRENVFSSQGFPYKVTLGTISSVNMSIPWKNLQSQSTEIEVGDVNLFLEPYDFANLDKQQLENDEYELKKAQLAALESSENPEDASFTSKLTETVISNVRLKIRNMHIRLRQGSVVVGMCFKSLSLESADENFSPAFVFFRGDRVRKVGSLEAFALYCDALSYDRSTDNLASMSDSIHEISDSSSSSTSSLVLHPVNGSVKIILDRKTGDFTVYPSFDGWSFSLSSAQYQSILSILDFLAFRRKLFLNWKLRPTVSVLKNTRAWWKYAFLAVRDKCRLKHHRVSWDDFRTSCIARRRYLEIYKRNHVRQYHKNLSPQEAKELEHLERLLPMEFLAFLRSLVDAEIRKHDELFSAYQAEKKKSSSWMSNLWGRSSSSSTVQEPLPVLDDVARRELYADLSFTEADCTRIRPRRIEIHVTIGDVVVKLSSEDTREDCFAVVLKSAFVQVTPEYCRFTLEDFSLSNQQTLLTFDESSSSTAVTCSYKYGSAAVGAVPKLEVSCGKLKTYFHRRSFQRLCAFFLSSSDSSMAYLQMELSSAYDSVLESFEYSEKMDMSLNIEAPTVIIPVDSSICAAKAVVMDFGSIMVLSSDDADPKYTVYTIRASNLFLAVDDCRITDPVEVHLSLKSLLKAGIHHGMMRSFVHVSCPSIAVSVTLPHVTALSFACKSLMSFVESPTGHYYPGHCLAEADLVVDGKNAFCKLVAGKVIVSRSRTSEPDLLLYVNGCNRSVQVDSLTLGFGSEAVRFCFPNASSCQEWNRLIESVQTPVLIDRQVANTVPKVQDAAVSRISCALKSVQLRIQGTSLSHSLQSSDLMANLDILASGDSQGSVSLASFNIFDDLISNQPLTGDSRRTVFSPSVRCGLESNNFLSIQFDPKETVVEMTAVRILVDSFSLPEYTRLQSHVQLSLSPFAAAKLRILAPAMPRESANSHLAKFRLNGCEIALCFKDRLFCTSQSRCMEVTSSQDGLRGTTEGLCVRYHSTLAVDLDSTVTDAMLFGPRVDDVEPSFRFTVCENKIGCHLEDFSVVYSQQFFQHLSEWFALSSAAVQDLSVNAPLPPRSNSVLNACVHIENCTVNCLYGIVAEVSDLDVNFQTGSEDAAVPSQSKLVIRGESHACSLIHNQNGVSHGIIRSIPLQFSLCMGGDGSISTAVSCSVAVEAFLSRTAVHALYWALVRNVSNSFARFMGTSADIPTVPAASVQLSVRLSSVAALFSEGVGGAETAGFVKFVSDRCDVDNFQSDARNRFQCRFVQPMLIDCSAGRPVVKPRGSSSFLDISLTDSKTNGSSSTVVESQSVDFFSFPGFWLKLQSVGNNVLTPLLSPIPALSPVLRRRLDVTLFDTLLRFPLREQVAHPSQSSDFCIAGDVLFNQNSSDSKETNVVTLKGLTVFLQDVLDAVSSPVNTYLMEKIDLCSSSSSDGSVHGGALLISHTVDCSALRSRLSINDLRLLHLMLGKLQRDIEVAQDEYGSKADALPPSVRPSVHTVSVTEGSAIDVLVEFVDDLRGFDSPLCKIFFRVSNGVLEWGNRLNTNISLSAFSIDCFSSSCMAFEPFVEDCQLTGSFCETSMKASSTSRILCVVSPSTICFLQRLRTVTDEVFSFDSRQQTMKYRSEFIPLVFVNRLAERASLSWFSQGVDLVYGVPFPISCDLLRRSTDSLLNRHTPSSYFDVRFTIHFATGDSISDLLLNFTGTRWMYTTRGAVFGCTTEVQATGSRVVTFHSDISIRNACSFMLRVFRVVDSGFAPVEDLLPDTDSYIAFTDGFCLAPVFSSDNFSLHAPQVYSRTSVATQFVHLKSLAVDKDVQGASVSYLISNSPKSGLSLYDDSILIPSLVAAAPFVVRNEMPVECVFLFSCFANGEVIALKMSIPSGESRKLDRLNPKQDLYMSVLPAGVYRGSSFLKCHCGLGTDGWNSVEAESSLKVMDRQGRALFLTVDSHLDRMQRVVTVFSEFLIVNNTGLKLDLMSLPLEGGDWQPFCGSVSADQEGSLIEGCPLVDVPLMFSSRSCRNGRVYLSLNQSYRSKSFVTFEVGQTSKITCQADSGDEFDITMDVKECPPPLSRCVLVTVRPCFVIKNSSERKIGIVQVLDSTRRQLISCDSQSAPRPCYLLSCTVPVVLLTVEQNGTVYSSPIRLDNASEGFLQICEGFCPRIVVDFSPLQSFLTIESSPAQPPYLLVNETDATISLSFPKLATSFSQSILPQSQKAFGWPTLNSEHHVAVVSWRGTQSAAFYFEDSSLPNRPFVTCSDGSLLFCTVKVADHSQTIVFSAKSSSAVSHNKPWDIVLQLPLLHFSIVDTVPREIILASFMNTESHVRLFDLQSSFEFKVGGFQIDNQLPECINPILLCPAASSSASSQSSKPPFLHVSTVVAADHSSAIVIPYFSVLMREFNLMADTNLISAIGQLVSPFMSKDTLELQRASWNRSYYGVHVLNSDQKFLKIGSLELNSLKFSLTFNSALSHAHEDSPGVFRAFYSLQRSLINCSDMPLRFNALSISNLFSPAGFFLNKIVSYYAAQARAQLVVAVGSVDMLGNPVFLVKNLGTGVVDFFVEPAQGIVRSPTAFLEGLGTGSASLLSKTIESSMNAAQKITGTVSKAVTAASFDKDYVRSMESTNRTKARHLGEGLEQGGKALAKGLFGGIVGLVTKPVEGAKKDGVAGFFKGVGKGIAGVAAKPVSGALTFVAKTTEGVKNTPKFLEGNEVQRILEPRYLISGRPVSPYVVADSLAHSVLTSCNSGKYNRPLHFCCLPSRGYGIAVTDRHLVLFRHPPPSIDACFPVGEVQSVTVVGHKVVAERSVTHESVEQMQLFRTKRIEIDCPSPAYASTLATDLRGAIHEVVAASRRV
eukprot:ANDGO_04804.mRNA.1 Putative vacuolar protein sorting-associated protein 13A